MHALGIHDRKQVIEPMSADEAESLVACFGTVAEASEELEHLASRTLARLRDQRQWIACSCMPGATDGPPLMAPRQREGVLHFFRLAGTPHAVTCPFFREVNESGTDAGVASTRADRALLRPVGESWLVLDRYVSAAVDPGSSEDEEGPGHRRAARKPSLATVLFAALEDLGLSRIRPTEVRSIRGQVPTASSEAKHYQRLGQLTARELAPGISWRMAGCAFLPAMERFMTHNLPGHLGEFGERRPQGLFIGLIQSVERDGAKAVLHWKGKIDGVLTDVRLPVDGTLKRFGAVRDAAGPFWCAAAVGQRLGEDAFRIIQAYVHPVYSKALLFPVDSNLERLTAQILLDQLSYWAKPAGLNTPVTLLKPVFDIQSADGSWCRPDFILELDNGRQIVVETMGRDDPEYIADKERTHPRMRGIPGTVDLVTYRPGQDDEGEFRRTLTRLIRTHA